MNLSQAEKKRFRTIGHKLKPVVSIAGKGLSESVCNELNRALDDHELIKVKLANEDREQKKLLVKQLCTQLAAEQIQMIGNIALIFRAAEKPKPHLSNLLRSYKPV